MLPNLYLFPKIGNNYSPFLFSFYSKWLLQPMRSGTARRAAAVLWKILFSSDMKIDFGLFAGDDIQPNFVYITAEIIKFTWGLSVLLSGNGEKSMA